MKLQALCLIAVCVAPVFGAELMTSTNGTELPVVNRTVINAWQSSYYVNHWMPCCFWGRSASREDAFINTYFSHSYFHSNGSAHDSNGYHWFVVQLRTPAYVTAVSILGRNDNNPGPGHVVFNRAAGVEIWTSAIDVDFSGADHCSARNLSQYFRQDQWKLCGVTRARNGNVVRGETLVVNCTAEVKFLLLRRYVRNLKNVYGADYMSFAGIHLTLGERHNSEKEHPGHSVLKANVALLGLIILMLVSVVAAALLCARFITIRQNDWQRATPRPTSTELPVTSRKPPDADAWVTDYETTADAIYLS